MSDDVLALILQTVRQTDGRVAENGRRLNAFDQHFQALDQRFQAFDQRFQAFDQRFHAIEQRLDKLEARVARNEATLISVRSDLMERMDRLQDAMTAIRDDIGVNFGRADRAVMAADNTREELRGLGAEVSAMQRQITRLQTDMRTLKGGI